MTKKQIGKSAKKTIQSGKIMLSYTGSSQPIAASDCAENFCPGEQEKHTSQSEFPDQAEKHFSGEIEDKCIQEQKSWLLGIFSALLLRDHVRGNQLGKVVHDE